MAATKGKSNNNNNRRSQPAVCWQAILWRSQSLSPASTLFCLPRASLLHLIPQLCLCCWSQLSFPCCPCTFCNQMRLTPTIVFGFSCCNIAAFYRCGKLTNWQPATASWKLETGKYSFEIVLWSAVTDIAMAAAATDNAVVYTNLEWLLKLPHRHSKQVKTTHKHMRKI